MNQQNTIFGSKETKKLSEKLIPGLKKGKKQKEEKVQIQICKYLHKFYPNVIFTCDLSSGMKLPIHIAAKNKQMRSSRGLPDLFIAAARDFNVHIEQYQVVENGPIEEGGHEVTHTRVLSKNTWYGLFLELKSEDVVIYNKDGSLRKDPHLAEQNTILEQLTNEGYKAVFAVGFQKAKEIIDEYLKK
jgi:hypothetical protein